jgi:hypothetical protein
MTFRLRALLFPRGEALADGAVHRLVVRPRPNQVIVGVAEGDGLYGRARRRVVAIDQKHARSPRMERVWARGIHPPTH